MGYGLWVEGPKSEPQKRRMLNRRISKGCFALLNLLIKSTELIPSIHLRRIRLWRIQHSRFIIRPARNALKPV
jgi:hypothetical protein